MFQRKQDSKDVPYDKILIDNHKVSKFYLAYICVPNIDINL